MLFTLPEKGKGQFCPSIWWCWDPPFLKYCIQYYHCMQSYSQLIATNGCLLWYYILIPRHGKTGQNFLIRPATRLTCLKMTRFDLQPVLTRDPIDPTWTLPNLLVLPLLPTLSRLKLRCNSYKIFTYSSLLNMLCLFLNLFLFGLSF